MAYENILTIGALKTILNNEEVEDPVMQVLDVNKIIGTGGREHHELTISDSQNVYSFVMLETALNNMVYSGEITEFTIFQIKSLIINIIPDCFKGSIKFFIIYDLAVLVPGDVVGAKIGDPKPIVNNSESQLN